MKNFFNKTFQYIFLIMFVIVLFIEYFCSGMDYFLKKQFMLPNIVSLIIILIIFAIYYFKYKDKKDITDKKFKNTLIITSIVILLIQLFLSYNIYFYTDWDVKVIRDIVEDYLNAKCIKDNFYLSLYPNNLFLTFVIATIRKLPIIGNHYFTQLVVNASLVNIAGIFTALTVKNFTTKRTGLLSYLIMTPLVLLSPWIVIPYTDTLAVMFPIAVMYFYTKKEKTKLDYFLITFLSIVGYFIKPTVVILLMAMFIVEVVSRLDEIFKVKEFVKKYSKNLILLTCGILCAFCVKKVAIMSLNFEQSSHVRPFTFIHYLAMGQNEETLGAYSQQDIDESHINGVVYDVNKFIKRVTTRPIGKQFEFYTKKTLLNFNDGSFSWKTDGTFFYELVDRDTKTANFLRSFYYKDGKNLNLFLQVEQILWLLVLTFIPFIYKKNNKKEELVLMLALIGMTMFLTIFEPRTRYFYCYSPIFVTTFMIGIKNLRETIKYRKKDQ